MPTREIPRAEWTSYCDNYSRQHRGQNITVDVRGSEVGAREEIRDLPFEGISADRESISIIAGDTPENLVTHIVDDPESLRVDDAQPEVLEIEAADGTITIARLNMGQKRRAGGRS